MSQENILEIPFWNDRLVTLKARDLFSNFFILYFPKKPCLFYRTRKHWIKYACNKIFYRSENTVIVLFLKMEGIPQSLHSKDAQLFSSKIHKGLT
jgi:hypothetical protein